MATVQSLVDIMQRTGIGYTELGAAAGVSPTTIRFALESNRLPKRQHAVKQLAAFIERNAEARTRSDLRFV
jgi:hypothetical protein